MDLAEKNKATSKDPTVLASSAFYISIDQLCGVIAATGLSLSSQEIEVLASGTFDKVHSCGVPNVSLLCF